MQMQYKNVIIGRIYCKIISFVASMLLAMLQVRSNNGADNLDYLRRTQLKLKIMVVREVHLGIIIIIIIIINKFRELYMHCPGRRSIVTANLFASKVN